MLPDCHLVRTAIPFPSREDSLGVFHLSPSVPLASFAERVSAGDHGTVLAGTGAAWFLHPPAPRKAGYICTQRYGPAGPMHRITGSSSASYTGRKYHDGSTSVHKSRSPRKQGRDNHAIGKRPESASAQKHASPQHPPETGRIKQAPEVSPVCPLEDF